MTAQIKETLQDGSKTVILKNDELEVWINSKGCTILRLYVKDRDGNSQDVVLGHPEVEDYEKYVLYLGATAGRVCNRIKKGEFELNGTTYHLPINNGPNSLHGGIKGFSFAQFDTELLENGVHFHRVSPDMEEGYPGNLDVTIEFTLADHTLNIHYHAQSDQDTLVNLTNHSYFNLDGEPSYIGDHVLKLACEEFGCVDSDGLATGEIRNVEHTPFDFRDEKKIDEAFDDSYDQVQLGTGIDHHFIFNQDHDQAILFSEKTGIEMSVSTTLPGAQIYSANFLQGEPGKYAKKLPKRSAICIETQNMPDDIHINSENPTTLLRKDNVFDSKTSFTFKVR